MVSHMQNITALRHYVHTDRHWSILYTSLFLEACSASLISYSETCLHAPECSYNTVVEEVGHSHVSYLVSFPISKYSVMLTTIFKMLARLEKSSGVDSKYPVKAWDLPEPGVG